MFRSMRKRLSRGIRKNHFEIEPDEIFADSSNLPSYDTDQFEGRIERPIGKHAVLLLMALLLIAGFVYTGQLWRLQVAQGESLHTLSVENTLRHGVVFADRGVLYDRRGTELAWNEPSEDAFPRRVYAPIRGLSHVVGYVSLPRKDSAGVFYQEYSQGRVGAERTFDYLLRGVNGVKITETDAQNIFKAENTITPPNNGESITLSIDARLNEHLYTLLAETAQRQGFVGGTSVIIDVTNGEILALASVPEFDQNILTLGEDRDSIASFINDPKKPFLNRAVSGLYTPGSTIKPYIAVAALEEGVVLPEKQIYSAGTISIPHPYVPDSFSVFRDWKAHGWVDLRDALAVSSNIYFYAIGGGFEDQPGLGIERLAKYMRIFGFGRETGFLSGSEPDGVIPTPAWKESVFGGDPWRLGDTYNTAIGQYGFQVTPLQAVRAIGAIANGGTLYTPVIQKDAKTQSMPLGFSERSLEIVREGMRQAVTEGTAQAVSNPNVAVAAKTGTAQVGAENEFLNSWIVGFFPYENPRYAFATIMERAPAGTLVGASFVMQQFFSTLKAEFPEYTTNNN